MNSRFHSIEPLEPRIAPAFVVHYVDADGDAVTVTVSRGVLADADVVFDGSGTQLQKLGLNHPSFIGADVSVMAELTTSGGDGRADLGWLQMQFSISGEPLPLLGKVLIDGDLGKLTVVAPAGSLGEIIVADNGRIGGLTDRGVTSLRVGSMGLFGTSTGAPDLLSEVGGNLDQMRIQGDLRGVQFCVGGHLNSLYVGGDVVGGDTDFSGSILTGRDIGTAIVLGNLRGGAGDQSGALFSGENFGSLRVGGSFRGGLGWQSGHMDALNGDIGEVRVRGSLVGGGGLESGAISSALIRVVPFGDGGVFFNEINEPPTNIGLVYVGGSVTDTGVLSFGTLRDLQVCGSLFDARVLSSSGSSRTVTIHGEAEAGEIQLSNIDRLTIGGNARARAGIAGTQITILGEMKHLFIGGDFGSEFPNALSFLTVDFGITDTFKIRGDVDGALIQLADLRRGEIGGDFRGGSAMRSGSFTANTLGVLTIGGSVVAGTAAHTGELLLGEIRGSLSIGRDFAGQVDHRAVLVVVDVFSNGARENIFIGGSIRFADLLFGYEGAAVPAHSIAQIGTLAVGGDWVASNLSVGIHPSNDGVLGTADDRYSDPNPTTPPPSLGRLEIGGRIMGTANSADGFGIAAGRIGQLIIEGRGRPFVPSAGNDSFALGSPGDIPLREVPRPV